VEYIVVPYYIIVKGPAMQIKEVFYTLQEAADLLGVDRNTVWRWIKKGKLHAQKAGGVVFIEKGVIEQIKATKQVKEKKCYVL
jgi:excisionase family DNA binding protein